MRRFKWTSVAVGAVMGVLAVGGVAAVPSAPVQALSIQCQIGNDNDVAFQHAYGVTVAVSTIQMPACQSGKGSRVRIDYRIRNLDPQQPIFVQVTAPDGSVRQLQDRTVPGTVDFAESQRWTTSATSSKGTWTLTVASLGAPAILDSWKVWVIPGSCWRANYDDVTAAGEKLEWRWLNGQQWPVRIPQRLASSVVSSACTHFASADMRIEARLWNVSNVNGDLKYGLRLFRNGVEVPMTLTSETVFGVDGTRNHIDVVLDADGSQLAAAGTWTLQVWVSNHENGTNYSDVTLDQWVLHTSY